MISKKEDNFKIDGVDSWIHCMRFSDVKPTLKNINPYHYHEYIEILYFYEGEGYACVNENNTKFMPGSLIIINSNKAHDVFFTKTSRYVCIKFSPSVLYENEPYMLNLKYVFPFISDKQQYAFLGDEIKDTPICALIEEIMDEWAKMEYGFELVIRSDILKIFSVILRLWKGNGENFNLLNISEDIKKAIMYIANNYSTVTEKEVAKICKFSYNYFSKVFKDAVGKSFKDYVTAIKLSEAEKMLLSSKMSITEISQETGFSTTSHFISCFKVHKGITPAKFRKEVIK